MEMPENMDDESMKVQAQHIWSMLDDMANKDPAAYRKFIDKQVKDGKEHMKPPQPHMVVQTRILNPSPEMNLFINVMAWHRIPAPKSEEAPIPVMGGPIYPGKDEDGALKIVTVAFHDSVLEDFGIDSNREQERKALIDLAIDYLQDNHKVTLSRHCTVLQKDVAVVKGGVQTAQKSLTSRANKEEDKFAEELADLEKTFGPLAAGCKDSLLDQLSNISAGDATAEEPSFKSSTGGSSAEIRVPGVSSVSSVSSSGGKKMMIQEVGEEAGRLRTPEYELTEKRAAATPGGGGGGDKLVLKIKLPAAASVAECELDISQDDLCLTVPEKYELKLKFPRLVAENEAQAKFNKKSGTLTLNLPVVES